MKKRLIAAATAGLFATLVVAGSGTATLAQGNEWGGVHGTHVASGNEWGGVSHTLGAAGGNEWG